MCSYENGKIYLIKYKNDPKFVYVGCTKNSLEYRFICHRNGCGSLSNFVIDHCNGDWSDWYIELYENFPSKTKKELETREGEVQLEFYNNKYHLINTHISRKINFNIEHHNYLCECGFMIKSKRYSKSHINSNWHKYLLEKKNT